jgi:DeoR/GlpR family transcriptional regulator of sugar metabolism
MLTAERHRQILQQLAIKETLSGIDLAKRFRVSAETIRTDFIQLESAGKLVRIRGGAQRVREHRHGLPLPEREALNREAKRMIARKACTLIHSRDTLFLDASSTVLTMTDTFPDIEATVLTNANHVVVSLGDHPLIDVICTGGDYEQRSRSYVGILAEEAVQRYYLQWLFIGLDGFHSRRGASEVNPGQARLKERIIPLAEKVCVLADHTKLERNSSIFFARPNQIDILLTDERADQRTVENFRRQGIEVIICGNSADG